MELSIMLLMIHFFHLSPCVLPSFRKEVLSSSVLPLLLRAPHTYQKMALQYCNIILNCIYGFLICFI